MTEVQMNVFPIKWDEENEELVWLNITKLPLKETYSSSKDLAQIAHAIKSLDVRGAPILGEVGAYGVAIAANNSPNSREKILQNAKKYGDMLFRTRPTAVNLGWGIGQVQDALKKAYDNGETPSKMKEIAIDSAKAIQKDNIDATRRIGRLGKRLIHDGDVLMTVCNAGTLAIDGIGSALAPLRTAWADGVQFKVLVTYTAPLYQGARLTAWELKKDGIPLKVITDNMAGHLMREEKATAVWAGADRILGNRSDESGTVYNKIGTFGLALMAHELGVKMHVAAPTSTIDPVRRTAHVKIEQRGPEEVSQLFGGTVVVPEGVEVHNPAFDMTPPGYVSAIVTELGVATAPYSSSLPKILEHRQSMVK